MAFNIPAGVSNTRCGALPSRGLSVVPFSTTAPASLFEKPSTRVYSSPNPTHPDKRTIGEAKASPQKENPKGFLTSRWTAFIRSIIPESLRIDES